MEYIVDSMRGPLASVVVVVVVFEGYGIGMS